MNYVFIYLQFGVRESFVNTLGTNSVCVKTRAPHAGTCTNARFQLLLEKSMSKKGHNSVEKKNEDDLSHWYGFPF